jgi:hypothetical protein
MQPQELGQALEDLFRRLEPAAVAQWRGATPDEIQQLEQIAGRPLPEFYRWFLARMGQSTGLQAYGTMDLSLPKVLECYAQKRVAPDPRFLLIGYENEEHMPLHLFYDLERPARDDAQVGRQYGPRDETNPEFETFHEMLAWGVVLRRRIQLLPQRCVGTFSLERGEILSQLAPVMESLGFTQPLPTGAYCAVFERDDAAMVVRAIPRDEPPEFQVFRLAGPDEVALRRVLGALGTRTSLQVEIDDWDPLLPG